MRSPAKQAQGTLRAAPKSLMTCAAVVLLAAYAASELWDQEPAVGRGSGEQDSEDQGQHQGDDQIASLKAQLELASTLYSKGDLGAAIRVYQQTRPRRIVMPEHEAVHPAPVDECLHGGVSLFPVRSARTTGIPIHRQVDAGVE